MIFAEFSEKKVLGYADKKKQTIVVARRALDQGKRMLIEIIIEEQVHLKSDANDKTRDFQHALINEMMNYMCKEHKIVL